MKNKEAVCSLTFKVKIPEHLNEKLSDLYVESYKCLTRMVANRTESSTKNYPEIPAVLSKALIRKYQRNAKLKKVSSLVLPICGDKGKQVKIVDGGD